MRSHDYDMILSDIQMPGMVIVFALVLNCYENQTLAIHDNPTAAMTALEVIVKLMRL